MEETNEEERWCLFKTRLWNKKVPLGWSICTVFAVAFYLMRSVPSIENLILILNERFTLVEMYQHSVSNYMSIIQRLGVEKRMLQPGMQRYKRENYLYKNLSTMLKELKSNKVLPSVHSSTSVATKTSLESQSADSLHSKKKRKQSNDRKEAEERWRKLAAPRRIVDPNSLLPKPEKVPLRTLQKRLTVLASPRFLEQNPNLAKPWKLTHEIANYECSDRMLELSKHKIREVEPPLDPTQISRSALKYERTQRIEELATPKVVVSIPDRKSDAFEIKREALKAKCSKRIRELAKPVKKEEDKSLLVNPFKPKKNAINLRPEKLSSRVVELATPKGPIPEIKRGGGDEKSH